MKKSLLLATTAIIASAGIAANAHAVDVQMYGQVNKGIMMSDDGNSTNFNVVDNDVSSTRFGVRGSQQLDNGLTASVLLEMEAADHSSDAIDNSTGATVAGGSQATVDTGAGFTTRHARVGLAGNWGAVFVGRTSTATDGVTEVDLGPVQDVMTSGMNRIGGGLTIGGGAAGNGTVSSYVDNFNGIAFSGASSTDTTVGFNDRLSTVRYDSPIVSGFQARVAAVTGGDYDAAVYYNGKVNDFQVAGGIGYVGYGHDGLTTANVGDLKDQISGSVSVKHNSGVSLTAAYGQRDYDNKAAGVDTPYFYYAKLGYAWNKWGFGLDYGHYKGVNLDGNGTNTYASNHANAYGAGVQYDLGHGVSASAYYQAFKVKSSAITANDDTMNLYGVNLRVKF